MNEARVRITLSEEEVNALLKAVAYQLAAEGEVDLALIGLLEKLERQLELL